MKIGVIGAGRIGANAARLWRNAGHDVMLSFSRDPAALEERAAAIGARAGTPAEAAAYGDVVMLSVPWRLIDAVLADVGSLAGKIVVDTTNQFGAGGVEELPEGRTAAQVNADRLPGARYTKAFNTLTSGFQAEAAGRTGPDRVAMFLAGDDADAKDVVARLIDDAGFSAIDVGGTADAAIMEAPRREGAVYGEEFNEDDGRAFVAAARA